MKRLIIISVLLLVVPAVGMAQMECAACHDIHGAAGGTLNTADEFDVICDACHGPAGAAVFADRHVDPTVNESSGNSGQQGLWEMGCKTCHAPHTTDAVNHLYDNGATHVHDLNGAANNPGGFGNGINIKLLGRDDDGTGIAKIATPLRINQVSAAGPCTNSDTEVEIFIPPFVDGDGPPATIMVGDRITINNSNPVFDGTFRVKETNWNGFSNSPPTGWVCFDHPLGATYSGDGFVRSTGWHRMPEVQTADWSAGTATLQLRRGLYSIRAGDNIYVSGVSEVNPGTFNGVKTVTGVTNSNITAASWSAGTATLTLSDTHLYQGGGTIYVFNVASHPNLNGQFTVSGVSGLNVSYVLATDPGLSAPPPFVVNALSFTAGRRADRPDVVVLTLDRAHPFVVNDTFTVTGISPAEFNGTWTVTDVPNANEIEYQNIWDPDPGPYVSGGEIADPGGPPPFSGGSVSMWPESFGRGLITYAASDPGTTGVRGGSVEYVGSRKAVQTMAVNGSVLDITLTNSDANINQFQAATPSIQDGDIITVFGATPAEYNGRWEVESVSLPSITIRCPPYFRSSLQQPACPDLGTFGAYISDGEIQSTGSMRPVVFESRGTDNTDPGFLSDHTHSFANTDEDEDGWMDGPCETCHTQTAHHTNDDLGSTHNNGRTCSADCHTHSTGFDKASAFCPPGRTCPPVN